MILLRRVFIAMVTRGFHKRDLVKTYLEIEAQNNIAKA